MKTMKTYIYSVILISLFMLTGTQGYSQGKNLEKTYTWKSKVNENVIFEFNNYDCDLVIHIWDKPEIVYNMDLKATMRTEEEARKLDDFLQDLKYSQSAGRLEFDNRFWTSKKVVMGKKTMTLKGEGKLRFSEFKMKGELWMPENSLLDLRSKYSEINMEDIKERLTLNLYNDKLYGGTVNSPLKVTAKYSSLDFDNVNDIEADLYNTSMDVGDMGDLHIVSKYSDIRTGNAGKVDIDAYNDKYFFENTGDIRFIDKYSDLNAGISGHIKMECYNSTVNLDSAQVVNLSSKYSKYYIDGAQKLNLANSYNDKFEIASLISLKIVESRYSNYEVEHLETSLSLLDGYSDKFFVTSTGAFKETRINGKYLALEMALDKELSYRFEANVKYPKFNIDEEAMKVRIKVKEGPDLQMEGIKGKESEGMPAFFINGYEIALTLTESQ